MSTVPVTITAQREIDGVPINNVNIKVFSMGGSLVAQGVTGEVGTDGLVSLILYGDAGGTPYRVYSDKFGWGFVPENFSTIIVTDPESPPNDFIVDGIQGTPKQDVRILIRDDTVQQNPVQDVLVSIFSADGSFLTKGLTDSSGELRLYLETGETYTASLYKEEVDFLLGPTQYLQIVEDLGLPVGGLRFGEGRFGTGDLEFPRNSFNIAAHVRAVPESTDPLLCKLSGYLTDVGLVGSRDTYLRFTPEIGLLAHKVSGIDYHYRHNLPGRRIAVSEVVARPNRNGYVEISLVRDAYYLAHLYGLEHPANISSPVYVPDAAGWKLEDVLFPFIEIAAFSPTSLSVSVGGSSTVSISATASDTSVPDKPLDFLTVTSDDPDVATVSLQSNLVMIVGVSAGSTTIRMDRTTNTYAGRSGPLPALLNTVSVVVA